MPENIPDLFTPEPFGKTKHIYSISEITRDIKGILEGAFSEVWVEGEVSNFKPHPSGHFYFSLKDTDAVLSAIMFNRVNRNLKFEIKDGLKLICFGKISVYAPQGKYQLIIEKIEPKGLGAQQLAFQQLKEKLFKEGLFSIEHKKVLPVMPFCVGIATSSAGAALRDILQILKKGAPCVDIIIRSTRVQGEGAAGEIATAIEDLNKFSKMDLIIICRGGGSVEDLWAFNEEIVARAVYNSRLPTVSAVGHQINTSLSDLCADVFVETPSAAAKIIVDKKNALLSELDGRRYRIDSSISDLLHRANRNLTALKHMLKSPSDRLQEKAQFLDEVCQGLGSNMLNYLSISKEKFNVLGGRLSALSPLAILSRGYSLTTFFSEGTVVKEVLQLKKGDRLKTVLAKGNFLSIVEEIND